MISHFNLRSATLSDLDRLYETEQLAWEGTNCEGASRDLINERIKIFPEGTLIAEAGDGKIAGFFTSIRITDYAITCPKPWNAFGEKNAFGKIFDAEGKVLYGVSLTVSPEI